LTETMTEKGKFVCSLIMLKMLNKDVQRYARTESDYFLLIRINNDEGLNHFNLGLSNMAMISYKKSFQLLKYHPNNELLATTYNLISRIYIKQNKYPEAYELLRKALKVNEDNNYVVNLCSNYNSLGLLCVETNDFKEALFYFNKALQTVNKWDNLKKSFIYQNIGTLYVKQKKYALAQTFFDKAINEDHTLSFNINIPTVRLNQVKNYVRLGKYSQARQMRAELEKEIQLMNASSLLAEGYYDLYEVNISLKDTVNSLKCLQKYVNVADSIRSANNESQLQQLLIEYDVERLQSDNSQLKHDTETYRQLARNRAILLFVSIVSIVLLFVIVFLLRSKNKAEKRNNKIIQEQQKKLRELEQKEFERKKAELNSTIDYKNRQLTSFTIDLSAINDFHNQICERIDVVDKKMSEYPQKCHQEMRSIIFELSHHNDKALTEDFRKYFNEVQPQFYDKLKARHPNLTSNDTRLCAFLFLGLSTKEIASLTLHEVRAVEKSRQRLRKKLDLEDNASIQDYLGNISASN
jgi:tetratricopeptide (TPR) repeat protein